MEASLGIPFSIFVPNAKRRLRDEAKAAPFEVRAKLEGFGHSAQRSAIPFPWNDTLVLIFNFGFAFLKLGQKHHNRLEKIEGLEAAHNNWFAFVFRDPLVGPAANHGRNMAGSDEPVQPHIRRVKDRADGGNNRNVITQD